MIAGQPWLARSATPGNLAGTTVTWAPPVPGGVPAARDAASDRRPVPAPADRREGRPGRVEVLADERDARVVQRIHRPCTCR